MHSPGRRKARFTDPNGEAGGGVQEGSQLSGPEVPLCRPQRLSRAPLFAAPQTVAHRAPLSMAFFRQEHWTGVPFPFPGHLPDPGIQPTFPALADGFHLGSPFRKRS